MKISRSSIYWKTKKGFKMGRYHKKDDTFYLEKINKIIEIRPTYGYKRVTAMINKRRYVTTNKTIRIFFKKSKKHLYKYRGQSCPQLSHCKITT
jgi:hypothetical protein